MVGFIAYAQYLTWETSPHDAQFRLNFATKKTTTSSFVCQSTPINSASHAWELNFKAAPLSLSRGAALKIFLFQFPLSFCLVAFSLQLPTKPKPKPEPRIITDSIFSEQSILHRLIFLPIWGLHKGGKIWVFGHCSRVTREIRFASGFSWVCFAVVAFCFLWVVLVLEFGIWKIFEYWIIERVKQTVDEICFWGLELLFFFEVWDFLGWGWWVSWLITVFWKWELGFASFFGRIRRIFVGIWDYILMVAEFSNVGTFCH